MLKRRAYTCNWLGRRKTGPVFKPLAATSSAGAHSVLKRHRRLKNRSVFLRPTRFQVCERALRQLPIESLSHLLTLFNHLLKVAVFLPCWRYAHSHVIPFLKPDKDVFLDTRYRARAHRSCLRKTYEGHITRRFVYFLKEETLFHANMFGFRAGRSTLDHLVRLESFVLEDFIHQKHCVSAFFIYKRHTWHVCRHGILRDLYDYGVRGRMLWCIHNVKANIQCSMKRNGRVERMAPRRYRYSADY